MARVILTCVGTRDPYHQGKGREFQVIYEEEGDNYLSLQELQKGPVLSLLGNINVEKDDKIYLLSTRPAKNVRQPTELNGEKLRDEISRLHSLEAIHRPMNDPSRDPPDWNPSAYRDVFRNMKDAVVDIIEEEGEKDYFVAYQSGTPQMQASWLVLVNTGLLPARLLRSDGKEEEIKPFFEDEKLNLGVSFLRSLSFEAAGDIFEKLSKGAVRPEKKGLARAFSNMAFGYHSWSIFHYAEAREKLKSARKILDGLENHLREKGISLHELGKLKSEIGKQVRFLDNLLKRDMESVALDLFHSARREFEKAGYTEVLWRCSLLWEFLSVEIYKKIIGNPQGFLSGRNAAQAISKDYPIFGEQETLELFSTQRNRALHPPPKAVTKETAEKALRKAEEILEAIDCGLGHPFSPCSIRKIADLVEGAGLKY